MSTLKYSSNPFKYQRRISREVSVGNVKVGGSNPIRVQSMITCDTMDTDACVKETLGLVEAGCEIVRITAPTVKDAANLQKIKKELLAADCHVPIVADIHFKPDAAMEAAQWVEKVRVNPGNYADRKKFAVREYSDDQYAEELVRLEESFTPLVKLCQERNVAMRIGTNHGSLSDRIMNRYGDTPLGMVESALEFARIARKCDFHNFVFSMKASNPKVMINAYRLLTAKLIEAGEDWNYPLHLGVTEAGDGEDGRIKSAIGMGSLLADGLGDTVRVSLTEDAIHEIPVAQALVRYVESLANYDWPNLEDSLGFDAFNYARREAEVVSVQGFELGGTQPPRVYAPVKTFDALQDRIAQMGDTAPEIRYEESDVLEINPLDEEAVRSAEGGTGTITVSDDTPLHPITAFRLLSSRFKGTRPILLKDRLKASDADYDDPVMALLGSSIHIGALLCDGIGDAILIRGESSPGASIRLGYNILQASGNRIFKTDYVACPSCGRTLFNLQTTTAKIKAATEHLKGVRIAVMGCIVNGPGEMADADFGYVGGAPGKVNLYIGKKPVKFNIPEAEAVDRLVDLIKENDKWVDPEPATAEA